MSTRSVQFQSRGRAPRDLTPRKGGETPDSNASGEIHGAGGDGASHVAMAPWKRVLDLGFLLLILPIWAPLFLLIAIYIKLVSPGPVFYRQERVGYRGRRFVMLKFRSMRVNAETGTHEDHFKRLMHAPTPMTKLDSGDPRLILGGRILRATGMDELPQFLHVWRREMSIVGPRPCTSNEFRHYQPWQCERLDVLPGLTGYWQVNGKNSTTFEEMIRMDIRYARSASFFGDLVIMLKTLPVLLEQTLRALKRSRRLEAQVLPASSAAQP